MDARAEEILRRCEGLRRPFRIAIDGRCAAGKTTLAGLLAERLRCPVLHMDDFFLRPAQRTAERLAQPGGNADYERFLTEVLLPLEAGTPFSFRPYDCQAKALAAPVSVVPGDAAIVEGAYCCRGELWEHYDLHVFLSVESQEQRRRIRLRNGAAAEKFENLWIPMEERYFAASRIEERCELRFS